ncbi:NAD-dependent deacylase [Paludibacter sp. 221]|uniref:SIR2 family NAD-dependent protein deacylase n=1 Tax=Paludibacter sp. 221 TaxID=2302939 RepID=UPI0013D4C384|nr:NAD-dependent deacylase [Paludibacter sp. 221]NDV45542.1 NAD-dependent deacylase [Paludibacter sp. 221]
MKKLVVLTGAGMSAESGISTFRDAGGLWEKYPVEEVATPEGWQKNPALVLDFYNQRRKQLLDSKPNEGHKQLVELEKYFDIHIVTQNVDNLHERAGSSKVLHLHGELMKVRSTGYGQEVFDVDKAKPEINVGDLCPKGYQLRPHIVWFGESVPEIENAAEIVSQTDVLVIIGTSLQVYPAAGLVNYAKRGIPVFLIDPNEVAVNNDVHIIRKGASEGIWELAKILLEL